MTTLTGLVQGQTIELDERVPELEGKRVRVLVESAEDTDAAPDRARNYGLPAILRGAREQEKNSTR
jgi:hypothetical protein